MKPKDSIKDSFKTIEKELATLQVQVADLSKKKQDLETCLKEFVDDVMISYGSGKNKVDSENLSWPDLEVTFNKAITILGYKKPKDTTKKASFNYVKVIESLYPPEDWKYEVSNGDTNLGYKEWVEHKQESDNTTIIDWREEVINKGTDLDFKEWLESKQGK